MITCGFIQFDQVDYLVECQVDCQVERLADC